MNNGNVIIDELRKIITPHCELEFENNFELLISTMLSAKTTDKAVNEVGKELYFKYPNAKALASAEYDSVYNIIKRLGLAKGKSQNIIETSKIICEEYNGEVPSDLSILTSLPGVGRKTALVVRGVGFHIPSFPVDTHVLRVSKRLGLTHDNADVRAAEGDLMKIIDESKWIDAHHLLLLFGRYICKSQKPLCQNCNVKNFCKLSK